MCSDETNINESYCELYYSNDTISVPFDVKDIPLVAYGIYAIKSPLHISKARPMATLHNIRPYLEWKKSVGMYLDVPQ